MSFRKNVDTAVKVSSTRERGQNVRPFMDLRLTSSVGHGNRGIINDTGLLVYVVVIDSYLL